MGEPSTALGRVEGGGQPVLSFEQCFFFCSFPFLFAFVVGGLGFEFCVFVAGWRHALRSEWPFIIIIIISSSTLYLSLPLKVWVCPCMWGPNRIWPGSGLVIRCLGSGFTALALGPWVSSQLLVLLLSWDVKDMGQQMGYHSLE